MNRLGRPVAFTMEPDVVSIFANISFGAAGAPTLNQTTPNTSKGLCGISLNVISITATTDGSTAVLTAVSSFAGLYVGMGISGAGIPAGATISSMAPGSATITISANTTAAHSGETVSVSGGQYVLTFGRNISLNQLDAYVKLLGLTHSWDESGLQGGASTGASSPAAPAMWVVANNISNASLANIIVQFGSSLGVAANPANGERVRLSCFLCRSTAV